MFYTMHLMYFNNGKSISNTSQITWMCPFVVNECVEIMPSDIQNPENHCPS